MVPRAWSTTLLWSPTDFVVSHRPTYGLILACHFDCSVEPHMKLPDTVVLTVLLSEASIVVVGDPEVSPDIGQPAACSPSG
jgi:hypothetical protein